jgi:hypothetical protein
MKKLFVYIAALAGSTIFMLLFVVIFVNSTDLACALQADQTYTCRVQTLLLGRFPTFQKEVTRVVDVIIVDDGCSDGCAYRAEFVTSDGGQTALNEVYTDYNPVSRQIVEIKRLLHGRQASFEYSIEPQWWVVYLLGGLFIMDILILTFTFGLGAVREFLAQRDQLPS